MCPPRSSEQIRPMPWQTGKRGWAKARGRCGSQVQVTGRSPAAVEPRRVQNAFVHCSTGNSPKTWTRGGLSESDIDTEKHDSSKMTFQKHPNTQRVANIYPNILNMISNILKNHPDLWVYWHSIEFQQPDLGGYSRVKPCNYSQPAAWVWFSSCIPGGHTPKLTLSPSLKFPSFVLCTKISSENPTIQGWSQDVIHTAGAEFLLLEKEPINWKTRKDMVPLKCEGCLLGRELNLDSHKTRRYHGTERDM